MLSFYPRYQPWSYVTQGMAYNIPSGKFYTVAEIPIVRSVKPQEFILITDHTDPVRITVNNADFGMVPVKSQYQSVYLNLYAPPAVNMITADNGVDEPVHLSVSTTYMVTMMEGFSRELYENAVSATEQMYYKLSSKWTSFIMENLLPWQKILPDVRSLRLMSVKMAANEMFNEKGTQGGITDFASAFCLSTPIWDRVRNPELWQPDLYQPLTSADDRTGYDGHCWFPNLCVARWIAFVKLMNNVPQYYDMVRVHDDVVTVVRDNTINYEIHLFDTTSASCSIYSLLQFLGCMDNITAAGNVTWLTNVAICAYATPMDQVVEFPGVGGRYFDSGPLFDTGVPFDDVYDIDILTDFWVGMSTKKTFDFGHCLDSYSIYAILPEDTNCCQEGPDAVYFGTMVMEQEVVSTFIPNYPLYGGDTPGLLENPYFAELA